MSKKNIYKTLCVVACVISLIGCEKKPLSNSYLNEWMQPNKKLKVLSTTAMIDDLVSHIGGEYILHRTLIQGELDPHSYELVKGDQETLFCADIVFYNGLELEHGASLKYQLEHHPKSYSMGDALVRTCEKDLIFFNQQVDPHIWMDVQLFSSLVPMIVEKLSQADPEHAEVFKVNGEKLQHQMLELDLAIDKVIQSIPKEKRYLITSHDAFFYFARRYLASQEEKESHLWKERFAAPEGLAPDGQISPKDIQTIVDYAIKHRVSVVFPESNVNRDALKKVVHVLQQRGETIELAQDPLYGDALGEQGSYMQMMEYNALKIAQYLKGRS